MSYLKVLALVFLVVNAGVWFGTAYLGAGASGEAGSGRLPRVADLQLAEPDGKVTARQRPSEEPLTAQRRVPESVEPIEPVQVPEPEPERPTPEIAQAPETCVQVGWFDTEAQARETRANSENIPASARVTEDSLPLPPFHWVLLPAVESRAEAYERFQQVRSRGIDAYLVTEGPQENAISLGLFESRRAAENVLSERQSQGLEAILASFPRNQIRYALFFEAVTEAAEKQLPAVLDRLESEFESVVKSRCEGIATPQKNP